MTVPSNKIIDSQQLTVYRRKNSALSFYIGVFFLYNFMFLSHYHHIKCGNGSCLHCRCSIHFTVLLASARCLAWSPDPSGLVRRPPGYFAAKARLAAALAPDGLFVTWTGCTPAMAWDVPRRLLFGDPALGAGVSRQGGRVSGACATVGARSCGARAHDPAGRAEPSERLRCCGPCLSTCTPRSWPRGCALSRACRTARKWWPDATACSRQRFQGHQRSCRLRRVGRIRTGST